MAGGKTLLFVQEAHWEQHCRRSSSEAALAYLPILITLTT